jgi:pimeloyl-ACP methyl ester carboxylesterase
MWDERPDVTDTLRSLNVPALLVWASNLNNLIPRSRLVVFDCDDHWVARIYGLSVARGIRALTLTS